MKIAFAFSVVLLFAGAAFAQHARKALFVIVDGIPADVIERVKPPTLYEIARVGAFRKAYVGGEKGGYSQSPTISAVGYNSLLTGTWANKHNVWDNDIVAPNYAYWNIFRLLKTAYPDRRTAVFSTWRENRTRLVGSESEAAGNLQPDYYFDGLEHDTVTYPHDTAAFYLQRIDEAVTDTAAEQLRRVAPDLTWVYLEYTDEMGHMHGNGSQLDDAVLAMDNEMKRLWDAIQYRHKDFGEDWVVYITTDHGRDAGGYNHGGQSDRERTTWIVTNARHLNPHFTNGTPAIVDILPSLARFLDLPVAREKAMEMDGIPLIGKISADRLEATQKGDAINLTWHAIDPHGSAKIWLTTTNHFASGGKDNYRLVATVPVRDGQATLNLKPTPSDFYKIVVETPFNFLNTWVVQKK